MGISEYGLRTPSLRDITLKRGLSREIHLLKRGLFQESPLWRGDLGVCRGTSRMALYRSRIEVYRGGRGEHREKPLNIIFALSAVKDLLAADRLHKGLGNENLDC
jgi:hypothetical protein